MNMAVRVKRLQPAEIIDAQGDLFERLKHDSDFRQYQSLTFQSAVRKNGESGGDEWGAAWAEALTQWVEHSYAYRVTEDMCTLLEHAQASLDESDTFDAQLAPTDWGIVHFERPIPVMDVRGKTMLVHWAIWGPADVRGKKGLGFSFYNDHFIQPDEVWADFHRDAAEARGHDEQTSRMVWDTARRICGRWNSVSQGAYRSGDELGPSLVGPIPEQHAELVGSGIDPGQATNLYRYMHALFLLLNQTLVQVEDEEVDRTTRRRAQRRGLPHSKVTVIQLRRTEGARQQGESMVEWSHRWVVRGHWRWQACGVGRQERRRIWIAPFIKGPEDAPIIVTDKLYSLER